MDASQYKDYVLVLLFVNYVSGKAGGDPGSLLKVPYSGSFRDMVRPKGDTKIGDTLNKIIRRLPETKSGWTAGPNSSASLRDWISPATAPRVMKGCLDSATRTVSKRTAGAATSARNGGIACGEALA